MRVNLLILSFLTLLLVLAGALFASSLAQDTGYVLLLWQGWQVQTSMGFALLLVLSLSVLMVLLLLFFSALVGWSTRYRHAQSIQDQQRVLDQLQDALCYQMLDAPAQALDRLHLKGIEQPAGWLRLLQVYFAGQARLQGNLQHYLAGLPQEQHAIANLLKARWLLSEQQPAAARGLLSTIYPDVPTSVTLADQAAFELAVRELWAKYAILQPWDLLSVQPLPSLDADQSSAWLAALLAQMSQAQPEQQAELMRYYDTVNEQALFLEDAGRWVRVLAYMTAGQPRALQLAQQQLFQQLDVGLLYDWLMLTIQYPEQSVQHQQATSLFEHFNQRYPAQPAVRLAQAYWYDCYQQSAQANRLVQDWPTTELFDRLQLLRQISSVPLLRERLARVLHDFATVESGL
ncbi:MAG: heme biosynthesis HemY N-terminal domain-containing protein [Pseudomonadota bacterium]|nr:heme biosynthesis HemY N-terminal domain-containing protein [Pseudomonadota bacterium]